MIYLIAKSLISASLLVLASETARRFPAAGALIVSIPLVAVLAMVWLWVDTGDNIRLAQFSESTFWFVIPSLPMFLLMSWLLRSGVGFWPSLLAGCLLTVALYFCAVWLLSKFGVQL